MLATLRKSKTLLTVLASALTLAATACATKAQPDDGSAADTGLSPTSANVVYPKGWIEFEINANSAKNTVDSAGHYHTDRNMCAQPGEGVYDVAAWNALATALNRATAGQPLTTPSCWDSPANSKFFNQGLATLILESGDAAATATTAPRRQIFEFKNGQICTTIAEPELATALMEQIESSLLLVDRADAETCPNYRPPGSLY